MNSNIPKPKKSFWRRPEGIPGALFLAAFLIGGGYLLYISLPFLIALAANTLYLVGMLMALGAILYMVLDPKMRNLIWYMYKSAMRGITGLFVNLDPIGVLKSYVDDLKSNLRKMNTQIVELQGQSRKLNILVDENEKEIEKQLALARHAQKKSTMQNQVILATRKAARLKESNEKYNKLLAKMDILIRLLKKMYQNSLILIDDTESQVKEKEIERKMIRASHSAMTSAMSVISGNPDQRAMFDMALESIADDVSSKVGEMERFMEMSSSFMNSVDLQNGVFEEEGLRMLEQWESNSTLSLLAAPAEGTLNLNEAHRPEVLPVDKESDDSKNYDNFFE